MYPSSRVPGVIRYTQPWPCAPYALTNSAGLKLSETSSGRELCALKFKCNFKVSLVSAACRKKKLKNFPSHTPQPGKTTHSPTGVPHLNFHTHPRRNHLPHSHVPHKDTSFTHTFTRIHTKQALLNLAFFMALLNLALRNLATKASWGLGFVCASGNWWHTKSCPAFYWAASGELRALLCATGGWRNSYQAFITLSTRSRVRCSCSVHKPQLCTPVKG